MTIYLLVVSQEVVETWGLGLVKASIQGDGPDDRKEVDVTYRKMTDRSL